MNSTKTAVSIMLAGSADGVMLPCYVVYMANNLYSTWMEGAPQRTRLNCRQSGWFDAIAFDDKVTPLQCHIKKKYLVKKC